MEITDKINYVLGKTVVYMLLIIYPFVMHNKLNDVTLTRFFFFIIVSYVGFLVLCINSLVSFILKRVVLPHRHSMQKTKEKGICMYWQQAHV